MNICLLFACMTVLPVIVGGGVLGVLYRGQARQFYMADRLIIGWLVVIGLAEAAHLTAVFLGWSLSKIVGLWTVAVLLSACVCGVIFFLSGKRTKAFKTKPGQEITPFRFAMGLVFVLLVIWQIMTIVSQDSVYRTGDMTVESVESFIRADSVHAINPLTGRAYEVGIPLRIRILGLPTLYSGLCSLFNLSGMELVWKYIPLMMLLLSYSAFWLIGNALFDGKKEGDKRLIFMVFTALVFCAGDYAYGMDGFGLLHCGFLGVTIRNMVFVPYSFALALRHKWRPAVLLVLAEACITWTLYGMGVCLVVLLGMACVRVARLRKTAGLRGMREEA